MPTTARPLVSVTAERRPDGASGLALHPRGQRSGRAGTIDRERLVKHVVGLTAPGEDILACMVMRDTDRSASRTATSRPRRYRTRGRRRRLHRFLFKVDERGVEVTLCLRASSRRRGPLSGRSWPPAPVPRAGARGRLRYRERSWTRSEGLDFVAAHVCSELGVCSKGLVDEFASMRSRSDVGDDLGGVLVLNAAVPDAVG